MLDKPALLDDRETTLRYLHAIKSAGREASQMIIKLQDLWWPTATLALSELGPGNAADSDGSDAAWRPLTILLVDDCARVREVIAECLTADGHHVEAAQGGSEALAILQEHDFDLVITDLAMPGMNGDTVASEVKRRAPRTAVIMLTGFGEAMKSAAGHSTDVDLVVSKPLTLRDLRNALATVRGGRQLEVLAPA